MKRFHSGVSWLTILFLACSSLLVAGELAPTAAQASSNGATGALQTTINTIADGGYYCNNGNTGATGIVNCNNYQAKRYVWFNAGGLDAGTYFWAVLDPGGQNDPQDGAPDNLSSSVDPYTNRTFTTDGAGNITYAPNVPNYLPHDSDTSIPGDNALRVGLASGYFADTPNPGGVYILAVCSLTAGYEHVSSKSCKYDSFKIASSACTSDCPPPPPPGQDLITLKTATGAFTRTYAWTIGKSGSGDNAASGTTASPHYTVSVSHDSGTDSDYTVTGDITVQNPNSGDAYNVDVVDNPAVTGIATSSSCSFNNPVVVTDPATNPVTTTPIADPTDFTLPLGLTADLPYTCTFSSTSTPPTSLTGAGGVNTANVSWSPDFSDGSTSPDSDNSGNPATANFSWTAPTTYAGTSTTVSDNFNNGGATTLGTVTYDPSAGTDSASNVPNTVTFTAGSPDTFTYAQSVTAPTSTCGSYSNTASESTNGGSAGANVSVCGGTDLSVSTTANPTFTRTYSWSITKSADKTLVEQLGGGSATFNYTVKASETGYADSAWQVTGQITVSNPNDWEDITATGVTDSVNNGGTCTVTDTSGNPLPATGVNVPHSSSIIVKYSCSYPITGPTANTGANTATVTWSATAASTAHGSTSDSSTTFAFGGDTTHGNPTEVNKSITVTDNFNNSGAGTLGTLSATATTPYTSGTYTYSHVITVPTYNCTKYSNTASTGLTGPGQTASATVEVCGPAQTGALTMGFWQNKNGQGIISAANQSSLGTWLRGYHPFSDAPSTGLATYVTNIIKAATCGGSTCNAMLRGQMLATALDVYFSDSNLGGNKIGAYNGLGSNQPKIGSVTIDLTKICAMTDGSGGSASCGGTFENVSSAFGGAATMTVADMLSYQNTSDPAADKGAVWYGQVKATQTLAKDAFDAINNGVAFPAP